MTPLLQYRQGEEDSLVNHSVKAVSVMEMSEEEILREAERIRARRGLRVARECAVCGKSFLARAQERYCSDDCQEIAQLETSVPPVPDPQHIVYLEVPRPGESGREFVVRTRAALVARGEMTAEEAELTPDDERRIEASEALDRLRERIGKRRLFDVDSTEVIRREREERSRYLASLHGWDE